jgi:two-component system nitrate/nitrite response regulator NarL
MGDKIRIVIADDHPIFREGIVETLSDFANCEIVAECSNADDAVEAVTQHLPDIVLLDINMPGSGIEAARRIAAACPVVRILMLTASENERDVMNSLEAGACGYVLKGIGGDALSDIIESINEGGIYVPPNLAARILVHNNKRNSTDEDNLFSDLTTREEQILKLVSMGQSNKEVGQALDLREKTVKHYMTNILQKLQVRNRVEAAIKARDHFPHD